MSPTKSQPHVCKPRRTSPISRQTTAAVSSEPSQASHACSSARKAHSPYTKAAIHPHHTPAAASCRTSHSTTSTLKAYSLSQVSCRWHPCTASSRRPSRRATAWLCSWPACRLSSGSPTGHLKAQRTPPHPPVAYRLCPAPGRLPKAPRQPLSAAKLRPARLAIPCCSSCKVRRPSSR